MNRGQGVSAISVCPLTHGNEVILGVIESTGAKLSPRRSFVDTWLDFIVNTKNHRTLAVNNSKSDLLSANVSVF